MGTLDFFLLSDGKQRNTDKMRLFLAVAVLMLAFVACTEAEEETVEQKLAKFGQRLTEMGETLAEKAKHTLEKIQNNEFTVMSRNWLKEKLDKMKTQFEELTQ